MKPATPAKPPTTARRPARRRLRRGWAGAALLLVLSASGSVQAQSDLNPVMTNVLLLVDTSGSMEYKTSSNSYPLCKYGTSAAVPGGPTTSEKSRWIDLVEVLTGTIENYQCQDYDRNSSQFKSEYALGNATGNNPDPYDYQYHASYHRPLSGTCAIGPGTANVINPASWPTNPFKTHDYNNVSTSVNCNFGQTPDGVLDSFSTLVRFGLMTFDTQVSASVTEDGTFSYMFDGVPHSALPIGCSVAQAMEVGSRNATAPPWEGRLVAFGDPNTGSTEYQTKNAQIQQVLRAMRPYGATPIAGMLSDARDFLWNDHTPDPNDSSKDFGPWRDPYAACRDTMIILLSDGQPNLDLRATTPGQADSCSGTGCPFSKAEDIADDLLHASGGKKVRTFVVGFALNTLTVGSSTVDCSALTAANLDTSDPTSLCSANPNNSSLQACCALSRIALKGDDGKRVTAGGNSVTVNTGALFANDRDQLRSAIASILTNGTHPTSRTAAAVGTVGTGDANTSITRAQYSMFGGFTTQPAQLWSGFMHRSRMTCAGAGNTDNLEQVLNSKGDLFEENLKSTTGRARTFYTVIGDTTGGLVNSSFSIRPNLSSDPDGTGLYSGTATSGTAATFVSNTTPEAMGLNATTCINATTGAYLTASACRDRYLKWVVGLNNGTSFSRCPDLSKPNERCSLMADIYHSSPRLVNRPSEFVRDESYDLYRGTYATRPLTVYTSSNDGMLHAFKVAPNDPNDTEKVDTNAQNEMWAFFPPQVLPHLSSQYPLAHQQLLDGAPVVKDVVASFAGANAAYKYQLRRSAADAAAGSGSWRTILIQSFGSLYPGYFALDVTNPDPLLTLTTPNGSETGGPQFLWQLTTDSTGTALFGTGGATPLITTLFFDDGDGTAQEYPVAVLPGGRGNISTTGPCSRATPVADLNAISGDYPPRSQVPCYTTNLGARSLTIVRLDTGKIVRTFRRALSEVPSGLQTRTTVAPLDSPISGQPAAYPGDTGSVADRIFVGDADGALWRVDVAKANPSDWSMKLFWDGYPAKNIKGKLAGWSDGQPIQTPPILSVDRSGNTTIAFSTGDQDAIGVAASVHYVWSLSEQRDTSDATKVVPVFHWLRQFLDGQKVTGSMSLFDSSLMMSTMRANPGSACAANNTELRLFSMDYLTPSVAPGEDGGVPTAPTKGHNSCTTGTAQSDCISGTELLGDSTQGGAAVVFGVPVTQTLTCFASDSTGTDPYLGGGTTHNAMSNVSVGSFQLLMNTGAGKLTSSGIGKAGENGPDNAVTLDLNAPHVSTRIDSWGAILE